VASIRHSWRKMTLVEGALTETAVARGSAGNTESIWKAP
jgi:hypothetical protein